MFHNTIGVDQALSGGYLVRRWIRHHSGAALYGVASDE
jgi:hypothetical protein